MLIETQMCAGINVPDFQIVSLESRNENSQSEDWLFCLVLLARPERFERPTPWFVAKYSIQLSYGRSAVFEVANYTEPICLPQDILKT